VWAAGIKLFFSNFVQFFDKAKIIKIINFFKYFVDQMPGFIFVGNSVLNVNAGVAVVGKSSMFERSHRDSSGFDVSFLLKYFL
jgi:hypothetical protein